MTFWQLLWASFFWIVAIAIGAGIPTILLLLRALSVSQNSTVPKCRSKYTPTHLLVVLGSGGHTAEMFSMLRRMQLDSTVYTFRTYVVSSGDNFSAAKAVEFETGILNDEQNEDKLKLKLNQSQHVSGSYSVVTVPRARRVHQSFLTAPFSTLQCFWVCLDVLRGLHPDQSSLPEHIRSSYPDVILTNGPATALCVIVAAKLIRLYHFLVGGTGPKREQGSTPLDCQLRTIFVESWARVTTLSLSGKLLLPIADRFLVQWPALEGKRAWRGMRKTEYVGALVD